MAKKQNPGPSTLIKNMMSENGIMPTTHDNSWEYVQKLQNDVRCQLINVTGTVMEAQNFLEAVGEKSNEGQVIIDGLLRDVQTAATEWRENAAITQGKSGFGKTPEEHDLITTTGLSFIQLQENMILQTAYSAPRLQEIVAEAEMKTRPVKQEVETPEQA